MSQAYSGVEANVFCGALDADVQGWTGDYEVSTFDSTTTADEGWDDETAATKKFSGSFDFFYNPSKPPFGTLGLEPGDTPMMILYVNKTADIKFEGLGLIKKVSMKSKTKEGFNMTATFTNKGAWTVPT